MSSTNAQLNMTYDHPAYTARMIKQFAANTAGSGSTSDKFFALTNLKAYGASFLMTTAGTSTYTVGGTATTAGTQISALYVTNTATGSISLSTTTIGPFTIGGATGTASGIGGPFALNTVGGSVASQTVGTNTLTSGLGGIPMGRGDFLYFVNGTDASAVWVAQFDYAVAPLANLTA